MSPIQPASALTEVPFPEAGATQRLLGAAGVPRGPAGGEHLAALCILFSRLPYENVTKILRLGLGPPPAGPAQARPLFRGPLEVVEGFLEAGAGGTCFSLTNLFLQVLADLGYRAAPFLGDMRSLRDVHCGLLVDLPGDGRALVDPGYLVDRPLPLFEGPHRHRTRHGEVCLEGVPDGYRLLTPAGGQWKERYRFRDRPVGRQAFLQAWAESFSGPGLNQLCLTQGIDGGYLYLHGRHLRRVFTGSKEARKLRAGDAGAAAGPFGIDHLLVSRAMEILGERRSMASLESGT